MRTRLFGTCFFYTSAEHQILWIPKCRVGADITIASFL